MKPIQEVISFGKESIHILRDEMIQIIEKYNKNNSKLISHSITPINNNGFFIAILVFDIPLSGVVEC